MKKQNFLTTLWGVFHLSKNKRLSMEKRFEIILPILEGDSTVSIISKKYNIAYVVICDWIRKFNEHGIEGLKNGKGWKKYSAELKLNAVNDILIEGLSYQSVISKYGISGGSVLKRWINSYNSGKELVDTGTGKVGAIMTKGRKTTYKERIEITEYTIARDYDYKSTMEKYNISYSQIYSWVQKYEKNGIEALQDRRGKNVNKEESELNEVEKLKLEIKRLKERNEYLEMQDAFEKKLVELKQRYGHSR